MPSDRDETSGRYVQKATLDDVAAVFDAVDGPPVVTSADVAEATDLSRDSARRKLETLRDRGRAAKRTTAGRSLYWPTDSERRETGKRPTAADTVGTTASDNERDTTGVPGRETAGSDSGAGAGATEGEDAAGDGASDAVEAALGDWTYGRSKAEREASRRVAREATAWLRDRGEAARKMDVPLDRLAEADPQDRTADTLWSQVVRPAWGHAVDRGYVRQPNSRNYQWAGDGDRDDQRA